MNLSAGTILCATIVAQSFSSPFAFGQTNDWPRWRGMNHDGISSEQIGSSLAVRVRSSSGKETSASDSRPCRSTASTCSRWATPQRTWTRSGASMRRTDASSGPTRMRVRSTRSITRAAPARRRPSMAIACSRSARRGTCSASMRASGKTIWSRNIADELVVETAGVELRRLGARRGRPRYSQRGQRRHSVGQEDRPHRLEFIARGGRLRDARSVRHEWPARRRHLLCQSARGRGPAHGPQAVGIPVGNGPRRERRRSDRARRQNLHLIEHRFRAAPGAQQSGERGLEQAELHAQLLQSLRAASASFLYGIDGTTHRPTALACVDFHTGERKWSQPNFGSGALMAADNHLIILDKGELIVADAAPEKYTERARAQVIGGKCWTVPDSSFAVVSRTDEIAALRLASTSLNEHAGDSIREILRLCVWPEPARRAVR